MGSFAKLFDRYKTYDDSFGRGNVEQWRSAFETRMQFEEAKELIKDKNPLSIMGFNSLPNLIELKERYRKLMLEHHPDKGGDPLVCKKIIASFTVLEKRLLK